MGRYCQRRDSEHHERKAAPSGHTGNLIGCHMLNHEGPSRDE